MSQVKARRRELTEYPSTPARLGYFAVITLTSTVVFYQIYVQGAVSPLIIADFGISLQTFVLVAIVGNAIGAVAAWGAGLADRFGRVNLILAGMALASLITTLALPSATNAEAYLVIYALLSLVGGVVLVCTSALIRDFSPQVGRATAMGLWAIGPSLGNLLISAITSEMLPENPEWQFHIRYAGLIGILGFLLAAGYLKELSPALRDQVMVSVAERTLVEARAREASSAPAVADPSRVHGVGTMWRPALIIPAIGISLFLMFYVTRIGFFVLYFVANFGYSPARANGLATWYWVANIAAFVVVGFASDRLRVRKPFLVLGTVISAAALAVFASRATEQGTTYGEFVLLLVLLAAGGGMVSTTWLALFSETVERLDPSAVARGMAVYGSVLRAFVVLTLIGFMTVVSAAGVLVDQGARVGALSTQYQAELQTLGAIDAETIAGLRDDADDPVLRAEAVAALRAADIAGPRAALDAALAVPVADLGYLAENGAKVAAAVEEGPREWQRWWWICFVGQVLVLPFSLIMGGRWSPRAAAGDARAHAARIATETAAVRRRRASSVEVGN